MTKNMRKACFLVVSLIACVYLACIFFCFSCTGIKSQGNIRAQAITYYVDFDAGNNSNSGTSGMSVQLTISVSSKGDAGTGAVVS